MAEKLLTSDLEKDRQYIVRRFSDMEREYQTFEGHYKELSEYCDPRRGRFFIEDRNKGDKRHKNIINSKATEALRRATAGMLAGIMSPARPWFIFTIFDKDLLQDQGVKQWLELFRNIILLIATKSNLYNMSPLMLRELLLFGVGCMTHVDDFEDVARFYTHTVGSYMIDQNERNIVDTIARKQQMTCYNIVRKFGLENVSPAVKNNYDNSNYGAWHTVCQLIEPNPFMDPTNPFAFARPYRSVYFEEKIVKNKNEHMFLRRSGFNDFPAYTPRWQLTGEDIYATDCPGMTALGDVKQLQHDEKELAKGIAKAGSPPLQGPPSLKNQPINNLPSGFTVNTSMANNGKIESLYKVDPRIQEMSFNIGRIERRIDRNFYVDLFMAITEMDGVQPRNELELSQVNEERLLMLGPALEQVHGEWLERMVQRIASQVLEADIMPEAPQALQGSELDIEFVSALAMAQKSVSTAAIERTTKFAGGLISLGFDNAADKLDVDKTIDEYAELVGAPARIIVPTSDANEARQARAQQQQQAQAMAMAQQAANVAKMASDAKLDDENVLSAATGRA